MMKTALALTFAMFAVGAAASCGILPSYCTDAGCANGLLVQLEGAPDEAFTLTVNAAGMEPLSIECPAADQCSLFFENVTAEEVTLTFESESVTVAQVLRPEYSRSRPNGKDCPPVCENGSVTFRL